MHDLTADLKQGSNNMNLLHNSSFAEDVNNKGGNGKWVSMEQFLLMQNKFENLNS